MLKKYYLIAITISIMQAGCAQTKNTAGTINPSGSQSDSSFLFTGFIPGKFVRVETDVLDNLYLLTNSYQLKKISATGDSIAVFNDVKRYGNPSLVDVSNPFKLLVYYRNF